MMWNTGEKRFSVCSLFGLIAVVSLVCIAYRSHVEGRKPITWEPFSFRKLKEFQRLYPAVLVYGRPTYNVANQLSDEVLADPRIRRSYHRGKFRALLLEYSTWGGPELRHFYPHVSVQDPFVQIYSKKHGELRLDYLNDVSAVPDYLLTNGSEIDVVLLCLAMVTVGFWFALLGGRTAVE